jgi:hypothetical protein
MNDSALQWLTDRASPPGTLACALRRPDGYFVSHSVDEICPAPTVEKILGHFDSLAAEVFVEQPAPYWNTWAFEQGQIRFVERPDGWRLALVVRTNSEASPTLDSLSLEFLSLPLDG